MERNNSSQSKYINQQQIKRKKKSSSRLKKVLKLVLLVLICTVVVTVGYVAFDCIKTVNGKAFDLELYKTNQEQTSIIYVNKNESYGEKFDEKNFVEYKRLHGDTNRIWVDFDEIPQDMKDAIIALEDKRFYKHHGVDWFRTASVMIISNNHGQGGSTITQQLVKNLTNKKEVTFVRKFNEILTALNLEKNYSKDDILETYLNTLYLGEGCYGIKTAAELYFGKEVKDLNLAECACLASITQAPGMYDPLTNPNNNADRRNRCLQNMLEQEVISQEEYDQAVNYKMVYSNTPGFVSQIEDESKEEDDEVQSYYVDYIISSLINDFQEQHDLTYNQAYKKVYYGGLKIYSAENVTAQSILEQKFENREGFPACYSSSSTKEPIQSAMTVMDYNGRVVAMIGGAGKKLVNRGLNRATDSPRQPGSSIKPLACYAPAMEKGVITEASRYIDSPGTKRNGSAWPTNYGGSHGSGSYTSIKYAISQSLNTVPYRIINEMGLAVSYDFLKTTLHFKHLVDGKDDADYSPLTVGGMTYGATSLEMTAGFAIFGSGGKYYKPYPYFKVTNSRGDVYFDNTAPKGEYAISPSCAEIMNRLLQNVITNGTGSGYGITGYKTFAKTGTTTDNKDRWFAGGTPYFVSAVWYGFDMPAYISCSASNPAGQIFANVLKDIHQALNLSDINFGFEDNPQAVSKKYCPYTGKLAGSNCYGYSTCLFTAEYDTVCDGDHSTSSGNKRSYYPYSTSSTSRNEKPTENSQQTPQVTESAGGNETPTSTQSSQGGNQNTQGETKVAN